MCIRDRSTGRAALPLKGLASVKRSRMISETAHNATAARGEKLAPKPLQVRDIAGFMRSHQRSEAVSLQRAAISSE